jgi:hypothetical protein
MTALIASRLMLEAEYNPCDTANWSDFAGDQLYL